MSKRGVTTEIEEHDLDHASKKGRYTPPFFVSEDEWAKSDSFFQSQSLNIWNLWGYLSTPTKPCSVLERDPQRGIFHKHIYTGDQNVALAHPDTETVSILGEGGQGIVYLSQFRDGKTVATKHEQQTTDRLQDIPLQQNRAIRTIDLERKVLKHEGLLLGHVAVLPQASDPKSQILREDYTVMEFVDGIELEKMNTKELSLEQRLTIAKLCSVALQHIHQGNFIYGDIKPANTKVKMVNGIVTGIRFLDFGYSLELKEGQSEIEIPASFGSEGYIAPEIKKGFGAGFYSDVYSLGALFCKDLHLQGFSNMTSIRIDRRPSLAEVIRMLDDALVKCKTKASSRRKI